MQIIVGYKYLYWKLFYVWEGSKFETLKMEEDDDEEDTNDDEEKSDEAAMKLTWWEGL